MRTQLKRYEAGAEKSPVIRDGLIKLFGYEIDVNASEVLLSVDNFNAVLQLKKEDNFIIPSAIFPISAFFRDGYITYLDTNISGQGPEILSKLSEVKSLISELKSGKEKLLFLSPHALDTDRIEAFFTEARTYILKPRELDFTSDREYSNEIELAACALRRAANLHFELEGIYSSAVDFSHHTHLLEKITEESSAIFDKNPLEH